MHAALKDVAESRNPHILSTADAARLRQELEALNEEVRATTNPAKLRALQDKTEAAMRSIGTFLPTIDSAADRAKQDMENLKRQLNMAVACGFFLPSSTLTTLTKIQPVSS